MADIQVGSRVILAAIVVSIPDPNAEAVMCRVYIKAGVDGQAIETNIQNLELVSEAEPITVPAAVPTLDELQALLAPYGYKAVPLDAAADSTPAATAEATETEGQSEGEAATDPPQTPVTSAAPHLAIDGVDRSILAVLEANGFDTVAKVKEATDELLKKIPGIGSATVAKLRQALGQVVE